LDGATPPALRAICEQQEKWAEERNLKQNPNDEVMQDPPTVPGNGSGSDSRTKPFGRRTPSSQSTDQRTPSLYSTGQGTPSSQSTTAVDPWQPLYYPDWWTQIDDMTNEELKKNDLNWMVQELIDEIELHLPTPEERDEQGNRDPNRLKAHLMELFPAG
jgi:hypothetical protein